MKIVLKGASFLGAVVIAFASIQAAEPPAAKKAAGLFPDKVVAKGKGFEIKKSEVEQAFISHKAAMAARGETVPEAVREQIEGQLLERLVIIQLLLNRATPEDKAKAREATEKVIADAKSNFPTEDALIQQLKMVGMTLPEFERRVLEQNTCESVLEREVKSKIVITDAEAKEFYDENPGRFEEPEMVRASHILISTMDKDTQQPLPAAKKKEKEEQIKKIRARAQKGEDFGKLAQEFSEDPGSKDKGGEYTFPRGRMVPEFEAAAFSLKPNQISEVVETQFGYHIIKLNEKIPSKKVELATVADDLKQGLAQREFQKQLPDFFEKLKKEAEVEIIGAGAPQEN
jgi:peptidyl-prolyl cis-trans isomerase C